MDIGGMHLVPDSSKAYTKFVISHGLPMRTAYGTALHPGTVDTALSQPFAKTGLKVRPAAEAASDLLGVLAGLTPAQTGALVDYQGQALPW